MTQPQPQPEQTVAEILDKIMVDIGFYTDSNMDVINPEAQAALNRQALATALRIVGNDEKGKSVQVSCPDLKSGCLVYHTAFQMTHIVKERNQLRQELRQAFTDYYGITDEETK
jgi:hypothetical protein